MFERSAFASASLRPAVEGLPRTFHFGVTRLRIYGAASNSVIGSRRPRAKRKSEVKIQN
jgi:hypothetical protein